MRRAPWPDFAGNPIHEGDTIRHPHSGESGVVVFLPMYPDPGDAWRVNYGDQYESRLCLQIDNKGMAVVVPATDLPTPKGTTVKTYIGTKVVNATPMTKDDFERLKGGVGLGQRVTGIHLDGYLVEYTDGGQPNVPGYKGYVSWSPKDVFERAYRQSVDFGDALAALKAGNKVAREGWNGKGMWLSLSCNPGGTAAAGSREIAAENFWSDNNSQYALQNGGSAVVLPCITMKTATGEILMGWLASQSDMLAEDWVIVP